MKRAKTIGKKRFEAKKTREAEFQRLVELAKTFFNEERFLAILAVKEDMPAPLVGGVK